MAEGLKLVAFMPPPTTGSAPTSAASSGRSGTGRPDGAEFPHGGTADPAGKLLDLDLCHAGQDLAQRTAGRPTADGSNASKAAPASGR